MSGPAPDPRRVLVVDDSFIMRRLVTEIVESDPDLLVCGSAENGKAALAQVRKLKPDVVLLDIEMPEMSGLETLRRLGLRSPSRVVILSSLVADEDAAERREALRLGAFAAVGKPSGAVSLDLKERRASEIVAVVRRAADLPALADPGGDAGAAAPSGVDADAAADAAAAGLMAALDLGVLSFDREGRLLASNPAAARLLASSDLSSGRRIDDVFDDLNGVIAEHLWQGLEGGAGRAELDYATSGGDWVPLRIAVSARPGPAGRSAGAFVTLEDVGRERRMKALLDRTLSASVADRMIAAEADVEAVDAGGQTREVTILFADLRGFTALSEALGAAGLVALLNEYFSFMADVIGANGGVIDKFIGDAIMALFGAPLAHGDDADRAVAAARDMVRALTIFNDPRRRGAQPPVRIGIGLASGPVIAGTIGSPQRLNYTVIGDAVNLAARLESQTKAYGVDILACGDTIARLTRPAPSRLVDVVRVVGQTKPTSLFEVSPAEPVRDPGPFASAFDLYRRGLFADAAAAFDGSALSDPSDPASTRLLARCRALAASPPSAWDGVWTLTNK